MARSAYFRIRMLQAALVLLLVTVMAGSASGAALHIPAVAGAQNEVVQVPVIVDKVDKLAGIKLVLSYDRSILKYVKAEKTTYTANMLYVVNDKVPGRLIVVMAAARGFAGENAPLVDLSFELLRAVRKEEKVAPQIVEAELMGDDLKKIEATFPVW